MTKRIHDILLELGVPANLKGHEALTIGIELVISDPTYLNRGVTTRLYPEVAQYYFGNTASLRKGKLTNSQFIAQIALKIRDTANVYSDNWISC